METLYFLLLLLGALCFFVAAASVRAGLTSRAVGLVPLGLLAWILVPLVQTARVAFK